METPSTVPQFLETIQHARNKWNALIEPIDKSNMTLPGVAGAWSLKDIIAHITWHERQMVGLIQAHALVGSDLWNLPTDERNAAIYDEVKDLPLEQVLEESAKVYEQLVEVLLSFSDEDLVNPEDFPGMPPDWQPGNIIAQNTFEHYQQHIPDVQRWMADGD
jgi:uncharacterized damage-inducible protein DinB